MASNWLVVFCIDHFWHGCRCCLELFRSDEFTCQGWQESFIDEDQPLTTRVYHANFFQDWQHIWSLRKSCFSSFKSGTHDFYCIIGRFCFFLGPDSCPTRNRQNGSFNRLHNGFISNFYTRLEGCCKCCSIQFFFVFDTLRKSAEQLRSDDSWVPTRTHQETFSEDPCRFSNSWCRTVRYFFGPIFDGHSHISPCISIWYRKDVQRVYIFRLFI